MKRRLVGLGIMKESGEAEACGTESLYGIYQKAGGDTRTLETLKEEAGKKIAVLAERGFDLGYGCGEGLSDPVEATARIDARYEHARRALYARLDDAVLRDGCPNNLRVRTTASDRDDYLAHPPAGETICEQDEARIAALYPVGRPSVQLVISDGLNANAVNENLRLVLVPLRRQLAQAGHRVGDTEIVIENGRVRAGYQVGLLLDVEVVIQFIGERPGTGIDTMSAYLTYGRDVAGRSRWGISIDHSWTTAVCGIHRQGKQPDAAASEITRLVDRMFQQHCSGVALS